MDTRIVVLGAGMVGVCCALELQRRGARVTLVDRREPGRETSYGNAGVIARSSLIPFNNPGLWRTLPHYLTNRTVQFRYDPLFLARHPLWGLRYLLNARQAPFEATVEALDALIRLSGDAHRALLDEAGARAHLRDAGWLFLYRDAAAFEGAATARAIYARHGIATETLDRAGLAALEPGLRPVFERALWVRDTMSVDDPGGVVAAYARLFAARGGEVVQAESRAIRSENGRWRVATGDGRQLDGDALVVALGPWSAEALRPLGLAVPMMFERGYHRHYAAAGGAPLGRPVYDTAGGYVLSPMAQGLRLSTGVELVPQEAPEHLAQLELAEAAAREAFALGRPLEAQAWHGSRPTLPDCRPMIGAAPGRPGLWLAFGHQHIGFSTGPGTARILGALMAGDTPPIPAQPYTPRRFLR